MKNPMNCQQHYFGTQQPMKRHIYPTHLSDLVSVCQTFSLSCFYLWPIKFSCVQKLRSYKYQSKTPIPVLFHSDHNFCDRLTLKLFQDEHKKSTLSPRSFKNRSAGHRSNPDQLMSCN